MATDDCPREQSTNMFAALARSLDNIMFRSTIYVTLAILSVLAATTLRRSALPSRLSAQRGDTLSRCRVAR